jgi:hypothetical protein
LDELPEVTVATVLEQLPKFSAKVVVDGTPACETV